MNNDNNENNNKIRRKKVSSSTNSSNKPTSTTKKTTKKSSSSTRSTKTNKKNDKFKFLRVTGVVLLVLLVVGAAGGTGLVFASLRNVEPVTKALLDQKTNQTTEIRYATEDLMNYAYSVSKKYPIPFDQMPQDLKNAVVAIEDERFYEHSGVDIKGLFRSVVKTLMGKKQGGSTIPMQVSKMLLTSTEQSLPRKVKDIYYAYEMSKTLSKNDILELYLNNFFVGKGLAGAEAGARGYFDKEAHELSLAESALLAGSTKNPSAYSAYMTAKLDGSESKEDVENRLLFFINTDDDLLDDPTQVELDMVEKLNSWGLIPNTDTYNQLKSGSVVVRKAANNPKAKKRQELVLMKMLELGYITQDEHDKAVAEEIKIKLPKSSQKVSTSVEDLIEYRVIDALMEYGSNTREEAYNMFYNGGLIINSTIDPKMQKILEEHYKNNDNFPGDMLGPEGIRQPQSASVILDYKTGQIKALVGGRSITARKGINRATTARQPGSTIKPLSVYTPAIDTLELTQSTSLSDGRKNVLPYQFKENNKWDPRTTTAGKGSMSLRLGLAKSSNPVTIRAAEMLGKDYEETVDIMIDYLKNFGISTVVDSKTAAKDKSDRRYPALTLGGMVEGISPLELAAAYGTLANGGVYKEPTIFTTITTYNGQTLIESKPEEHKVVDPEVAYVVTDMLKAVVTEGTGGSASLGRGISVAGKTGTTNDGLDTWFVGYTPYYVAATYIGDDAGLKYEDGRKFERRAIKNGSSTAAKLWSKIMKDVHKNLTNADFKKPDGVYFAKINLVDGGKSSSGSNAAFVDGTAPRRYTSQPTAPTKNEEEEETPTTPENGAGGDTPPNNGTTENPVTPPTEGNGNTTPQPPNNGTTENPVAPPTGGSGGEVTPPVTNTPEVPTDPQ